MNALRRVAATNVLKINSRNFVSRTAARRGGGGHDAHHDDHHGHAHPIWEKIPFRKGPTALLVFGSLIGGVTIVVGATYFQNWKHGFLAKKH